MGRTQHLPQIPPFPFPNQYPGQWLKTGASRESPGHPGPPLGGAGCEATGAPIRRPPELISRRGHRRPPALVRAALDRVPSTAPAAAHLQHVGHVKERAVAAGVQVGVDVAVPVLHRQPPAREGHQLPAVGKMEVIERRPAERVLQAAGSVPHARPGPGPGPPAPRPAPPIPPACR